MASKQKPSRAEKVVSEAQKKASGTKSGTKNTKSTSTKGKKEPVVQNEMTRFKMPGYAVVAIISLILFVLFLGISVNSEGWLLAFIKNAVFGLIGKVGFYFSIPALLYLFIINTFRTKTSIQMRSICLVSFVLLCGAISHISMPAQTFSGGFKTVAELYRGGIAGNTAGVVCGLLAIAIQSACGKAISLMILGIAAILTLMGSVEITIPSLIRAFQNRPREEWEDEKPEKKYVEPAERVVNTIANKQIERNRIKRQRLEEATQQKLDMEAHLEPTPAPSAAKRKIQEPKYVEEVSYQEPLPAVKTEKNSENKARDMLSQIEQISAPVAAAGTRVKESKVKTDTATLPKLDLSMLESQKEETDIPAAMPAYQPDAPIPDAPKVEEPVKSMPKEKVTAKQAEVAAAQVAEEIEQAKRVLKPAYCFPPIDLLKAPSRSGANGTDEMRENSRRLNETLASFKIDAHIINVTRGPSVTRYEVELDKGVRFNKLTTHADDIALSLGAPSVRIAAVPGKISVVGIEVPNRTVTMVSLREVIDSDAFNTSKSKSSFAVGKDIGGSCIIGNIAKMPHMLIAGTTGSGKSVCMNSIILSLLYKAGPEDVKLIMVDPKMVELASYNGIPHLMIPVVTDPKKAAGALQWAVTEMMRRYKTMSDAGVRDLESYNSIVMAEGREKTPQLIVIIDELADLMLVAAKEVEDSICRIAQMGRAAGIHLVIATQRPSADVITGLMKANIPSRIAFSVASAMESRIILDTQGAEKLVGKGDMLFAPIGSGKPLRVQGCFVSDGEVEAVTSYVKNNYVADYDQTVLADIEKKAQQTGKKPAAAADPEPSAEELDGDEMLPAAVDVILETGQASVSMLQRRLKLGYARAARIVDEMEEKGIVGPFQGSKPRDILITKEQWMSMRSGGAEQMEFEDLEEVFDGVPEEID